MRRIKFHFDSYQLSRVLLGPAFAILISFIIGWLFLAAQGLSPEKVYSAMLEGAFGSSYSISETLVKAIPIMLTALAASLSFRVKLWNIGAEGQLYLGAFAATGIAFWFPQLSPWILIPAMLAAGCLAGVMWNLIPGFLRAFWGVNETITTLMFNLPGYYLGRLLHLRALERPQIKLPFKSPLDGKHLSPSPGRHPGSSGFGGGHPDRAAALVAYQTLQVGLRGEGHG